jgi:hypothetical protein
VWLLKKFHPEYVHAEVQFVPVEIKWREIDVDSNPNVLYVDTGFGVLDHHQVNSNTCAAKLTLEFLKKAGVEVDEALERLVEVVNQIDHFREAYWPNSGNDRYDFFLESILDGWKLLYSGQDLRFIEWGIDSLDGIYRNLQNKVWAEKELENIGQVFKTRFGKGVAIETLNDDVIHVGLKMGFVVVARLDPKKHYLRVKSLPAHRGNLCAPDCLCRGEKHLRQENNLSDVDLGPAFEIFKKKDPEATWFLHPDHRQLLNGSTKSPGMKPTRLTLTEVIEVLKKI